MATEIKYLMNPYLAEFSYIPFKKDFLSEKQIIQKLQDINTRLDKLDKIIKIKQIKVSQVCENNLVL